MVKRFWGRLVESVSGIKSVGTLGRAVGTVGAAVAFVYAFALNTAMAADVTVPDIGVDWGSVGTEAGTALGEVVIGLIGVVKIF